MIVASLETIINTVWNTLFHVVLATWGATMLMTPALGKCKGSVLSKITGVLHITFALTALR